MKKLTGSVLQKAHFQTGLITEENLILAFMIWGGEMRSVC